MRFLNANEGAASAILKLSPRQCSPYISNSTVSLLLWWKWWKAMIHAVFKKYVASLSNHSSYSKGFGITFVTSMWIEDLKHPVGTFVSADPFSSTISRASCRCGAEEEVTPWTSTYSSLNCMQLGRNKPLVLSTSQQSWSTAKVLKYSTWHLIFPRTGHPLCNPIKTVWIRMRFLTYVVYQRIYSRQNFLPPDSCSLWAYWERIVQILVYRSSVSKERANTIVTEFNDRRDQNKPTNQMKKNNNNKTKQKLNNKCHSSQGFFWSGHMDEDNSILVCLQPLAMTVKTIIFLNHPSKILKIVVISLKS